MQIPSCLDCQNHKLIDDPDPDDWFCDDDLAIVCTVAINTEQNTVSKHPSERSPFRAVSVAIRPHKLRNESNKPKWCPLTSL